MMISLTIKGYSLILAQLEKCQIYEFSVYAKETRVELFNGKYLFLLFLFRGLLSSIHTKLICSTDPVDVIEPGKS